MITFDRPESLEEACLALAAADGEAKVYGGGTAIQILLKQGLLDVSRFVDLARVPGLDGVEPTGESLRIGALTTLRRVETDPLVREAAPLFAQACAHAANPRVRNTATIGGNLSHGDYRLDPPAALLALGAWAEVASPRGPRTIPLDAFFVDLLETALAPDEVFVAVHVPPAPAGAAGGYVKLSSQAANDWPCASVAALLADAPDGRRTLRLGLSAVAHVPLVREIDVTGDDVDQAVERAVADADEVIDPIPDVRGSAEHKRRLARVAVADSVRASWEEARVAGRP